MPTASDFLEPAASAFGKETNLFVRELADWCENHGRAGHRHAKTIEDHIAKPRKKPNANLVIPLLDYLYAHSGQADEEKLADVISRCRAFMAAEQQVLARYGQPLHSEPGRTEAYFESCVGVYALWRSETSNQLLRQELLVLREIPAERKPERLATYISGELVFRGHWESVGNAVFIRMHGYRPGHKPDVANVFLVAAEEPRDIMGGHLSGLTTLGGRDPVWMAILAIKIKDASKEMLEIGNEADQYLVARLSPLFTDVSDQTQAPLVAMKEYFKPTEIDAKNEDVARLSGKITNPAQLVSAELRSFCKDFGSTTPASMK